LQLTLCGRDNVLDFPQAAEERGKALQRKRLVHAFASANTLQEFSDDLLHESNCQLGRTRCDLCGHGTCTYRSGVELCRSSPLTGGHESVGSHTPPFRMILAESRGPNTGPEGTAESAEMDRPAPLHFLPAFPGTSPHNPHHTPPSGNADAPRNRARRTSPDSEDRGDPVRRTKEASEFRGAVLWQVLSVWVWAGAGAPGG